MKLAGPESRGQYENIFKGISGNDAEPPGRGITRSQAYVITL
jgi:hypothetical protein